MNLPFFLAKRIASGTGGTSFSKGIIRIAIAAIALSMAVMIVAGALVAGFKQTVSDKVFGFWGHIHITAANTSSSYEVEPVCLHQPYYTKLESVESVPFKEKKKFLWWKYEGESQTKGGIKHIQGFINKEGVIKTKENIEGIVLRGVGEDFDWEFMKRYMQEGDVLRFAKDSVGNGIMISRTTADRLELKIGDKFLVYFVQDGQQLVRKFTVIGVFKTGLEEYDKSFALVDLRQLQKLNHWRPYRVYRDMEFPLDSLYKVGNKPFVIDPTSTMPPLPPEIILIKGLYPGDSLDALNSAMLAGLPPDIEGQTSPANGIWLSNILADKLKAIPGDELEWIYHDSKEAYQGFSEPGSRWQTRFYVAGIFHSKDVYAYADGRHLDKMNRDLDVQVSGFEVFVDNISDLDPMGEYVYYNVVTPEQDARTIKEEQPNIFDWLSLQDINETIITTLMILIGILNMVTALLILIVERSSMIGILKALGASNSVLSRTFLWHAGYIIGSGLLLGNLLGIGLCVLQHQFGFITLPEDSYYVSVAPIKLELGNIIWLNGLTLFCTFLALILPSWYVARVTPVKAIRFK